MCCFLYVVLRLCISFVFSFVRDFFMGICMYVRCWFVPAIFIYVVFALFLYFVRDFIRSFFRSLVISLVI